MKIVLSALVALLLLGCSEDKSSSAQEDATQKTNVVVEKTEATLPESNATLKETTASIENNISTIAKQATDTTKKIAKKVEDKSEKIVKDINATVEKVKEDVAKVVEPAKTAPKTSTVAVDASVIYKTCATCHGANAEKKALNKSQIIKGWDSAKIVAALHGYKDGTYGSSMKGVMKPQVAKLNDTEIEAVAKYISNL